MSSTEEFSAFGSVADKVKNMVCYDESETCSEFYNSLLTYVNENFPGVDVQFDIDFKRAEMRLFSKQQRRPSSFHKIRFHIMFMKLAQQYNEDPEDPQKRMLHNGTHAVVAVKDLETDDIIFFDPNGVVKIGGVYDNVYCIPRLEGTGGTTMMAGSKELQTRWSSLSPSHAKVFVPKTKGIQTSNECPIGTRSRYIREGGYCMFYVTFFVLFFAEELFRQGNAASVMKMIRETVTESSNIKRQIELGIFPGIRKVGEKSVTLAHILLK